MSLSFKTINNRKNITWRQLNLIKVLSDDVHNYFCVTQYWEKYFFACISKAIKGKKVEKNLEIIFSVRISLVGNLDKISSIRYFRTTSVSSYFYKYSISSFIAVSLYLLLQKNAFILKNNPISTPGNKQKTEL